MQNVGAVYEHPAPAASQMQSAIFDYDSVLEIYGPQPTAELLAALAEYRLTVITALARGFRVSTADGYPAGSPNDS